MVDLPTKNGDVMWCSSSQTVNAYQRMIHMNQKKYWPAKTTTNHYSGLSIMLIIHNYH